MYKILLVLMLVAAVNVSVASSDRYFSKATIKEYCEYSYKLDASHRDDCEKELSGSYDPDIVEYLRYKNLCKSELLKYLPFDTCMDGLYINIIRINIG